MKQFELTYIAYNDNGSGINNLLKTIYTIITLIIGFTHYLIRVKMYSPLIYILVSIFIFVVIIIYGTISNLPKGVSFLDTQFFYDEYYELDLTEEKREKMLAQIIVNIIDSTNKLSNLATKRGKVLRSMQFFTILALSLLGLSLLEYLSYLPIGII